MSHFFEIIFHKFRKNKYPTQKIFACLTIFFGFYYIYVKQID